MERCARCGVEETLVKLFNAVYEGEIESLCERCSIIENIPLIVKPTEHQLRESEKNAGVHERMKKIMGIKEEKKEEHFFINDKLRELEKNPFLEMPEKKYLDLVEHFNWEIMNNRRRKGLSQKQLAEQLGEREVDLEMLEKGIIPENSENFIRKLEQFFRIKLKRVTETEILLKRQDKKPVLLDEDGNPLNFIPEPKIKEPEKESEISAPEIHCKIEIKKESRMPLLNNMAVMECKAGRDKRKGVLRQRELEEEFNFEIEKKDFDLESVDKSKVKISDLMKLHRKKIEATKQEKIEEQRIMLEKQNLIEAKKEELKLIKQKESREIDNLLGGIELLKKENYSERHNHSK